MDPAPICPEKTRADLEWDRLLSAIADRTRSAIGRRAAENLLFAHDRETALALLAEVREAVLLDNAAEELPIAALPGADPALERARLAAPLDADELRAVLSVLTASRSLRVFLKAHRERAPLLFESCSTDPTLDDLERELDRTFEPDGSISDRASNELYAFRTERRAVRDRLVRKLEELIAKHADVLQDSYYTEREGRYVLPVRAGSHERLQGIVHAESESGATVFVEPRAVVEQGNRLKMLDAQIERAIRAILAALSAKVAEVVPSIEQALYALSRADLRQASARLARDLRLTFPDVAPEEEPFRMHLVNARHPLLALEGVDVVPSDIDISENSALVVSGPNAGGKTVALKTLGLAALMLRAGLPVPAGDGSRLSLVETVLTDVGDDQNLHKNLSTFSAHIQNLAAILHETRRGALVLLDEICGGTDPHEGEALAAAILESLVLRGGAVVCTTHYQALKALALKDDRVTNASVGFDLATMSPTFRLMTGLPGPSSALSVAKRFGIPEPLIERAERFLTRETVAFEELVQKLSAERSDLDRDRAEVTEQLAALKAKKNELENELIRARTREKKALSDESQELFSALRRAREDLTKAQTRIRTNEDLRAASKMLDAIGQKVAVGGELAFSEEGNVPTAGVSARDIKVGSKVYVPKLRAEAEVVEILASGQIRVIAGALKLTTRIDDVRAPLSSSKKSASSPGNTGGRKAPSGRSKGAGASVVLDAAADPDVPIQTSTNTVDLRGLRAHEAQAMAEQFLDRMMGAGNRVAFLIHGHGTGALRQAVRDALQNSAYVSRSRAGNSREGGDGVTVVWLR